MRNHQIRFYFVCLLTSFCLFGLSSCGSASDALQSWIGNQLKTIANSYLNPQLDWDKLVYEAPMTVKISNARLVANDQGKTVDVFNASELTITLAEIPSVSKPIVIQEIIVDGLNLNVVSNPQDPMTFIGLTNLVKVSGEGAGEVKLTDVFDIRKIAVRDGKITYNPQIEGTQPMVLDKINTELIVAPDADAPGWYGLDVKLVREPVFETKLVGKVNINDLVVDLSPLRLIMTLGPEHDDLLPPQLQKLRQQYQVTGTLNSEVSGEIPLTDWQKSSLVADASMERIFAQTDSMMFPINNLTTKATVKDGQAKVDTFNANAFGGVIRLTDTTAQLNDMLDARTTIALENLLIEELVRQGAGDEDNRKEGIVNATINWQGPLTQFMTQSAGDGTITVRQARLNDIPIVSRFTGALQGVVNLATFKKPNEPSDEADIAFVLEGDKARLTNMKAKVMPIKIKGEGDIYLDTRLDMKVDVEPAVIGVGQIMGKVTPKVPVTGTIQEPKIGKTK